MATEKAEIILSAVDRTKAAFDSAKRGLGQVGDATAGLQGRFGSLGVAVTAALGGLSIKGGIDVLDQIDDLAEKSGIGAKELSGLRFAGEVVGTEFASLAIGVKKLSVNIDDAARGGKESGQLFKDLGINVKDANGNLKAADQVLVEIADRFVSYKDGVGKAALAQDLFGKSGADLIPLLNQGGAGIKRLREEAEGLGVVYGGDLAKKAADFNDNLKRLGFLAEASKVVLAEQLLPALNSTAEAFLKNAKNAGIFKGALLTLGEGITARLGLDEQGKLTKQAKESSLELAEAVSLIEALQKENNASNDPAAIQRNLSQMEALRSRVGQLRGEASRAADALKVLATASDPLKYDDALSRKLGSGEGNDKGSPNRGSKGDEKAADAAARAAERARKAYEGFIQQITLKTTLTQAELDSGEKLSESQQFALDIVSKLADQEVRFTDVQKTKIAGLLESYLATARLTEQQREQLALTKKQEDAIRSEADARENANQSLAEQVAEMGLTREQVDALRIARLEHAAALEEETIATIRLFDAQAAELPDRERSLELLREEIQLRRRESARNTELEQKLEDARTLQGNVEGFFADLPNTAKGGFGAIADDFGAMLDRMASQAAAKQLTKYLLGADFEKTGDLGGLAGQGLDALAGLFKPSGGTTGDFARMDRGQGGGAAGGGAGFIGTLASLATTFAGFFAEGGKVPAGKWGWAGEEGPEPIFGGSTGLTVQPYGAGGQVVNSKSYSISVQMPQGGTRETAAQFGADMARQLRIADARNG